jgi:hypothetical protein
LSGEEPIRAFKKAMLSNPKLKEIYEKARMDDFSITLECELNIRPPEKLIRPRLLPFQSSVSFPINQEATPVGFWTVYTPVGERIQPIISMKYHQLLDVYDTIPYVITNTGEPYDVLIDKIMERRNIPEPSQPKVESTVVHHAIAQMMANSGEQKESTQGGDVSTNKKEAGSASDSINGGEKKERDLGSNPNWWNRPYGAYTNAELRALKFRSVKEIDRAIGLLWEDPELIGMPRHYAGGRTMVVPQEAVELMKNKRLKFTVFELVDTNTLTPEQLIQRRKKYGM